MVYAQRVVCSKVEAYVKLHRVTNATLSFRASVLLSISLM